MALAQISAAIIAFIIAISTALYSVERERREQRTDDLRESIVNFRKHSEKPLRRLTRLLENSASNGYYLRELKGQIDRQKRKINQDSSRAMTTHALLSITTHSMWSIKGNLSPSEMDDIITEIACCHAELESHFSRENQFNRELYVELTDSTDDEVPQEYLLEEGVLVDKSDAFFGTLFRNDDDFVEWIENELDKQDSILYHPHGGSWKDVRLVGSELHLVNAVLRVTKPLLDSLKADKQRTLIDYNPQITRIIRLSVIILFIGVTLPLAFLLTPPSSIMSAPLPLWFVFAAQTVLLTLSVLVIIPLLELPLKQLSGEDDDDLSRISRAIVRVTDRLPF